MHNETWQLFFTTIYPVWALVGALVALNYGKRAHAQWAVDGGTWIGAVGDWFAVGWNIIAGCAADVWSLLSTGKLPPESPTPIIYSLGHLLRFFIMMSFVTSVILGVLLRNVDRSNWSLEQLVLTSIAVLSSIIAGLGHLSIAWHFKPRRWRWTCLTLLIAIPVVMWIRLP